MDAEEYGIRQAEWHSIVKRCGVNGRGLELLTRSLGLIEDDRLVIVVEPEAASLLFGPNKLITVGAEHAMACLESVMIDPVEIIWRVETYGLSGHA